MKAILISIQPQWVEKILNGEKTIEIRKTKPNCELPCKVYIYQTKKSFVYKILKWLGLYKGKVVAEFTLNKVEEYEFELWDDDTYESIGKVYYDEEYGEREVDILETNCEIEDTKLVKESCLNLPQLRKYLGQGISTCYAWHIDNLKIYDKPKDVSEFYSAKECPFKDWGDVDNIGCWESYCEMWSRGECRFGNLKLERPPRSWCYVEEMKSE